MAIRREGGAVRKRSVDAEAELLNMGLLEQSVGYRLRRAQLSIFEEHDGWRYQGFVTNTATGQLALLEARHRAHARVEDRIRHAKDSGLGRFPSRDFAINTAWLTAVAIAADLAAWLRLLALTGPLATAEPKARRYRLLHVPARLAHSARRGFLRIPATWPWVTDLVGAFARIAAIPLST